MDMDTSVFVRQPPPPEPVDPNGPLNKRQILYTNWLLLGLDVPTLERKYSIPFNRDMFNLPNKAGAEAVLYFLFSRLNQTMCREEFRDCWPVRDKKTEALFYRTCNKWLRNIQKDEPDSHLPRINASLFMSPGGEKFYQLLFGFTNYVVQQVIKRECDVKARDHLSWPQLTPHNHHLGEVMYRMLQCGAVQRRQKFLEQTQSSITVGEQWRETISDLVKENRRLSKSIRDLEHQLRDENQKAYEKGITRGSPMPSRKSIGSEQDRSAHMLKRAQRVQKVRDKWKKLDSFCSVETRERQVIESILDRSLQKYNIDAADISVKVPDLLLRECENEILKRHVDNTYEGGKLNILSLVQLWNLSLHLYIERFHQAGVASLETDSSHLTAAVQTHHAQVTNANAFEKMLDEDFLPLLKQSVTRLRDRLEANTSHFVDTPTSGRSRPLGLGLISATPPLSFTPKDEDSTLKQSLHISPHQDAVMTPEAADSIASSVAQSARKVAKTLFQGSPVYAPKFAMQGKLPGSNRLESSRIPQPSQMRAEKQVTVPGSRTPSSSRQLQHSQGWSEDVHAPLPVDHVSDMLSSSHTSQTSHSTLVQSPRPASLASGGASNSPRGASLASNSPKGASQTSQSPRQASLASQSPRQASLASQSPRQASQASTPRQAAGRSDSPRTYQLASQNSSVKEQFGGLSVDDFVDEVVSHMMDDEEDTENQPPMDYLQRLHQQEMSRSLPRSPFNQHPHNQHSGDLNTSNSNRLVKSFDHIEPQNDKNLSMNNINSDQQESTLLEDYQRRDSGHENNEIFRHPCIPDVEFKNGQSYPSSNKRQYVHRRSLGSEVFRHPEIPEDLSPEITQNQQRSQSLHSPMSQIRLEQENFRRNSEPAMKHTPVKSEGSLGHLSGLRGSGGEVSPQQAPATWTSGYSPPSQTTPGKSPDKKLGTLETEIRRMWRESLDGESVPATPRGETTLTAMSRTPRHMQINSGTNGHLGFGDDDALATLDDITADILLSPEKDDENPLKAYRDTSLTEDMLSIKTPQLPKLRSKYRVPQSPFLTSEMPEAELDVSQSNNKRPSDKQEVGSSLDLSQRMTLFDLDSHSPLMSQSLPVFNGSGSKTRKDQSITLNYVNTSHMRSVFDDHLDEPGLDEDTPPDILVSLDDSFTPLLDGLELQGKSPNKPSAQSEADPCLNDMISRFKQLRKNVSDMLHKESEKPEPNSDLLQSTTSSDERLMLDLEKKYVTGVNTSWSLLDDETLDTECLQDS